MYILYLGYLNHDEENAQFFDDKDGFVHTGDLGYFNEEGVLFYHGRKKELIKYQNCHISPIEIEDVAMQHSDIIDIGVYGFPDDKVQELVSAVVVKKEDSQLTEKDVLIFVNSRCLTALESIVIPLKNLLTRPKFKNKSLAFR